MSTPLPEGQQGAKAEELTDKIQVPSIKQLGILPQPFVLALEEITIISGTKKRNFQVEWDDKSFIIRKR
jgi:hypothetical protein